MAEMKFIGAAQQKFNSFMELVKSMLEIHCSNWNNPSDPRSYILPPVCSFKNADKSDEDIETIQIKMEKKKRGSSSAKSLNPIQKVVDRRSDSSEFVVFYALWALIQDNVEAPFIAVHGLNFDNVRHYLHQIFPKAQVDIEKEFEAMMREYDFVLIGPKIGMIVIEVKSTQFTKATDFAKNSRHLPDHITHALKVQLGSFDPTIFQVCSEREIASKIPIRKVLFTPNLKKDRFNTWKKKLDDATRRQVMDKFDGVIHWFSEDMDNNNNCAQKPLLYTTLRKEIEKTGYQISHEIFESIGLIISGLGSAVVLHHQPIVESELLSISRALLKDAAALESQNSKGRQLDTNATNVVKVESKLVLLTPEQQKALNGPNRQFIIGAPGTGKTIIFQAKVAQLLKEGKKVVIYAEEPYAGKYKKIFGRHESCKVFANQRPSYFPRLTEEYFNEKTSEDGTLRETLENMSEHILGESMVHEDLRDFDCIFIDDAFDWPRLSKIRRIYESISMMAIANSSKFHSKLVWIASDAYLNDSDSEAYKRILNQIIRREQGDFFTTAILDRVMRSSESVFKATYSTEVVQHLAIEPVIGHKIHGFYDSVHLGNLSPDDTPYEIWKHTYNAVKKFKEEGFEYGHMAIIIGGEQFENPNLHRFLLDIFLDNGIPVEYNLSAWRSPKFMTLDTWDSVSSFEWPVVIYIGMFEAHGERLSAAYNRYRACSRATMKLFEIIVDVEIELEAVDFYRGDDGLYVLVFYNRPQKISSSHKSKLLWANEHGGKLFKSIVGRYEYYFTIYKFCLEEIPGVCKDFLDLWSPTNDKQQQYLERLKEKVPLTLDGLEYYCRRGLRLDLVEFIVKAKKT